MTSSSTLIDDIAEDCKEWLEALDNIQKEYGAEGVREMLHALQNHALARGVPINEATLNTAYINTISPSQQPVYPGNIELEKRLENIVRWNAMAMVLRGQDQGTGVGGHIATYASAATMLEVGFNHIFRAKTDDYGGDVIMPQPHAAPGIYARAYLEGRISETQVSNFRRELQPGGGLCSYPHPRSLSEFWQVPNASMGLSTPTAIYQARFAKYLENRGLKPKNGGKIWCFIGDGESDEPEVLGTINIASREKLNNLVLVVNCNLQRLDGPVRGNGKIIQELERSFRGADWNVIKVIWGGGWDGLLAQDKNGVLHRRMEDCVDGDYQRYSILGGDAQREHWVAGDPELERMMNSLSDDEVKNIKRGGQDPKKVYAAFKRAAEESEKPTVILVKTVKGDGMGPSAQGQNTAHQKKNLTDEERIKLAKDYGIPLSDELVKAAAFYRPEENSELMQYLRQHRQDLGGQIPKRENNCPVVAAPELALFKEAIEGTGERAISTTTAVVRMLARLLKDKNWGKYIVPIVPDEARTFGMDGLFPVAGIYSPDGQNYTPVDADTLMPYKEATDGQILQEGICEAGAIASFMAAGTAYAMHGLPMVPFYIFYSIFGLQRVGDMIWACGDMMCRGFLLGGTAGRTTLNGEGLQHQDGHSHILASTVPNLKCYDPAFAYELAVIVQDGIRRMYQNQENIFYYLTVYNENYPMPALPQQEGIAEGILKGGYCFRRGEKNSGKANAKNASEKIHLLSSGSIMLQAMDAAERLESLGYCVDIWSIPSFIELSREADNCERWNRLNPMESRRLPYVEQLFTAEDGVFIAVTDYMKAMPNSIAQWMPEHYEVLGTDGYGLSESRPDLRDYFEISDRYITAAAISSLYRAGKIKQKVMQEQFSSLEIDAEKMNPVDR